MWKCSELKSLKERFKGKKSDGDKRVTNIEGARSIRAIHHACDAIVTKFSCFTRSRIDSRRVANSSSTLILVFDDVGK